MSQPIRLTQYSHGAGCGCKIAPNVLSTILAGSGDQFQDPRLWVGNSSRDDAAVYALELQLRDGSIDAHRQWIERLLNDYYDPMYHYQQSKVRERVVFRGDQAAILAFVAAQQD